MINMYKIELFCSKYELKSNEKKLIPNVIKTFNLRNVIKQYTI